MASAVAERAAEQTGALTASPGTAPLPAQVEDSGSMFERMARDPSVDVDKLERLIAMHERVTARRAEDAFNEAMSNAQTNMRRVAADANNPQTHSRYASYAALDRAIRPVYTENGFALSFDMGDGAPEGCVRVQCYVTHKGGHSRTYRADMPADGKGAKGGDVMTKTHAVGAAASYGMRYLLKMIFNVAVGEDDVDGNEPQPSVKAPEGYDEWLTELEAVADNGMPAFAAMWNETTKAFRTHLVATNPGLAQSLKVKAAKVAVQ